MRCKDCGVALDGEYELADERCAQCQADYDVHPKTFILMRFYDGGGLAHYDIVSCTDERLGKHLVEFERDCVDQNLGTQIGILEQEEFERIAKAIKGV